MIGQWIGSFSGHSKGTVLFNIEKINEFYVGNIYLIHNGNAFLPLFLRFQEQELSNISIDLNSQPIDRSMLTATQWEYLDSDHESITLLAEPH